jgi:tetrapyrrole methylase family protein/MazG family protein
LEQASARYVRTRRHPAVVDLEKQDVDFESFDELYEQADDLESVYAEIVGALVRAAADGDVVYAVPGNPTVAELTVELLRETDVPIEIVPGLSFADLAWSRLGVDPMTTHVRVVDARDPDTATWLGPLLIAQCDSKLVLSDVKLALLELLPPATKVVVLRHLGLPDEDVSEVALAELDHGPEPDHLTSLYVPGSAAAASAADEITRLLALAVRLRQPGGCPWDAEQTHESLRTSSVISSTR